MKTRNMFWLAGILMIPLAVGFVGCSNDADDENAPPPPPGSAKSQIPINLTITVDADGTVKFSNKTMPIEDVPDKLSSLVKSNPAGVNITITVNDKSATPYKIVQPLADACLTSNISRATLGRIPMIPPAKIKPADEKLNFLPITISSEDDLKKVKDHKDEFAGQAVLIRCGEDVKIELLINAMTQIVMSEATIAFDASSAKDANAIVVENLTK